MPLFALFVLLWNMVQFPMDYSAAQNCRPKQSYTLWLQWILKDESLVRTELQEQ